MAEHLRDKPKPKIGQAKGKASEWKDPFAKENLERDLFVAELNDRHSLVLNKFNVVPHHLLVITNVFESQDDPVNRADFEAVFHVLASYPEPALAFFNRGPQSGMSQPHKHIQIVPMPMAQDGGFTVAFPFGNIFNRSRKRGEVVQIVDLPFKAFILGIDEALRSEGDNAAAWGVLEGMLDEVRGMLSPGESLDSYNMLATLDWVVIVPRSAESCGPCSVNAMGFAGTFLLRSQEELDYIQSNDPLDLLSQVALRKAVDPKTYIKMQGKSHKGGECGPECKCQCTQM